MSNQGYEPRPPAQAISRTQAPLIKALDSIRSLQPGHWKALMDGLVICLDPDRQAMLRCPVDKLPTAQGRAQIADEILQLASTCSELAEKLRLQETLQNRTG